MNDPYSTLGVSKDASDDEIKKAYRELARKYHPDNYHDNPLADLAQEKMKEINEAYDEIMRMRSGKGGGSSTYGNAGAYGGGGYTGQTSRSAGGPGYTGNTSFPRVRNAISSGNVALAEQLLANSSNRNAEWYYLMGCVNFMKGWFDEAINCYQTAVNMEPDNPEYNQALAYAQQGGTPYRPQGYGSPASPDLCSICTTLMCLNMFCRCH